MDHCVLSAVVLPDIEMYGGDTQPWEISVKHENGISYTLTEMAGYTSVLTITPLSVVSYNASVAPVLTKNGALSADDQGNAAVIFEFDSTDTLYLRGKYIYQITFSQENTKLRVGQGKLIIKPNNNIGA